MEKYIAFISYRHRQPDQSVAVRLHRGIEHFHVPEEFRKDGGRHPGRVFRDEDELPLSTDLGESIRTALENSEFLIAVCTPEYPKSRWCMEELDTFIRLHGRDRVLAILAEGKPEESFPGQLLYSEDEQGNRKAVEPLAANITDGSGQTRLKRLKTEKLRLLASILGCSFDSLYQRAKRYRQRRILAAASAALAVAGVFIGTLINKNRQIQARYEEANANLRKAQLNESTALTENARMEYAMGRKTDALKSLLKALPEDPQQPHDPSAEAELTEILGTYTNSTWRFSSNLEQDSDIAAWCQSKDGAQIFTWDQYGIVRNYSSETGRLKWEYKLGDESYTNQCIYWCEAVRGILCVHLGCEEAVMLNDTDGTERWRVPMEGYSKTALIDDESSRIILLSNDGNKTVCLSVVNAENGKITEGKQLMLSQTEGLAFQSAQLSPNGRFAAARVGGFAETRWNVLLFDLQDYQVEEFCFMEGDLTSNSMDICFTPENELLVTAARNEEGHLTIELSQIDPMTKEISFTIQTENDMAGVILPVHMMACSSDAALLFYNRMLYYFSTKERSFLQKTSLPATPVALIRPEGYSSQSLFIGAFDNGLVTYLSGTTIGSDLGMIYYDSDVSMRKVAIDPESFMVVAQPAQRENELLIMRNNQKNPENPDDKAVSGNAAVSPSGEKILMRTAYADQFAVLSSTDDRVLKSFAPHGSDSTFVLEQEVFTSDEERVISGDKILNLTDGQVTMLPLPNGVFAKRSSSAWIKELGKTITAVLNTKQVYNESEEEQNMQFDSYEDELLYAIEHFDHSRVEYALDIHLLTDGNYWKTVTTPAEIRMKDDKPNGVWQMGGNGLLMLSGNSGSTLFVYDVTVDCWKEFIRNASVALAASGHQQKVFTGLDDHLFLYEFSAANLRWEVNLPCPKEAVTGISFSPDDSLVLITYSGNRAALYRTDDSSLLKDFEFEIDSTQWACMQQDSDGCLYVYPNSVSFYTQNGLLIEKSTGNILKKIPGMVFANLKTRKVYRREKDNENNAVIYPLYTREELLEKAKEAVGMTEPGTE